MQDFKNLAVWTKSHELVVEVYRSTTRVSDRSYPGLMSQMRRAASSIPTNIVEGCGHRSQSEFARFLQMAGASALELSYHLLLAHDLGAIGDIAYAKLDARTLQVRQMLGGLLRKVRGDLREPPAPRRRASSDGVPRTA